MYYEIIKLIYPKLIFYKLKNIYKEYNYTEEIQDIINEILLIFSQFGKIIDSDSNIDSWNSSEIWYEKDDECKQAILKMDGKIFKGEKLNVIMEEQ